MTVFALAALAAAAGVLGGGWLYLAGQEGQAAQQRLQKVPGSPAGSSTILARFRSAYLRTGLGRRVDRRLQEAHLTLPAADATVLVLAAWTVLNRAGVSALGLTAVNSLLVATLTVWGGARFYLASRRGWLIRTVNDQLPEVAWMMGNAMRAGLSVSQGLALVAREAPRPAGAIFQDISAQIELNRPLAEVLAESQARWQESREYRLFVLTVLIQHRSGGNLAGALEELSRTLAERKGINEEVRAATSGPRAAATILPFMPVIAAATMNMAIPGFLNPLFSLWGALLIVPFMMIQWIAYLAIRHFASIRV